MGEWGPARRGRPQRLNGPPRRGPPDSHGFLEHLAGTVAQAKTTNVGAKKLTEGASALVGSAQGLGVHLRKEQRV